MWKEIGGIRSPVRMCCTLESKKGHTNRWNLMKEGIMTQDERWMIRYDEVRSFIEERRRNPSKYYDEGKLMVQFRKRGKKLLCAEEMPEDRVAKFRALLELCKHNKHKNQYE